MLGVGCSLLDVSPLRGFAFFSCPLLVFLVRANSNQNQSMKITKALALAACALAVVGVARAQDSVAGKWKAEFNTQIGIQKYTFDFKVAGTNLTGKAVGVREMGTDEVVITEGRVSTNGIFFVEPLKFDDNELRIEYTGKVSGDEIKFHRKVGDAAEEDFVAKRVKASDAKPAAKPEVKTDTNSPPVKP
jgi:hypothetical protein